MRAIIPLFCSLFLLGCASSDGEIKPSQFDREFFHLNTAEQVEKYHTYGLEVQYELLIVGNQILHPPALYLTKEFAKQGRAAVALLRGKLITAKRETTIRDIVAVLDEMQRLGAYDVRGDASLVALAEERVAAMQGQWKPATQRFLEEIRTH